MKTAAISLVLCWAALWASAARADPASGPATRAATAPATAQSVPTSLLMAHGSPRYFWIVEVTPAVPVPQVRRTSTIFVRSVQGGDWQEANTIEDGIVDMANQDNELIVLLDSGEWRRLPEFTGNTPLPGRQRILAITAAGPTLWAIASAGSVSAGPVASSEPADANESEDEDPFAAPTTRAASQPSSAPSISAATAPATGPAGPPHLWNFPADAGAWVDHGELPAGAAGALGYHMAVVQGELYLAFYAGGRIHTYRGAGGPGGSKAGSDSWQDLGSITPDHTATGPIQLLATPQRPLLWVGGPGGGWFWVHGTAWTGPQPIGLAAIGTPKVGRATVAVAGEEVRFLVIWGGRLCEQSYDFGLVMTKSLAEFPLGAALPGQ